MNSPPPSKPTYAMTTSSIPHVSVSMNSTTSALPAPVATPMTPNPTAKTSTAAVGSPSFTAASPPRPNTLGAPLNSSFSTGIHPSASPSSSINPSSSSSFFSPSSRGGSGGGVGSGFGSTTSLQSPTHYPSSSPAAPSSPPPHPREKTALLKQWTENLRGNVSKFSDGSKIVLRKHQKCQLKNAAFVAALTEMSTKESNNSLRNILQHLANAHSNAEQSRSIVLAHYQKYFIENFEQNQLIKLKLTEANIKRRNTDHAIYLEKYKKFLDSKREVKEKKRMEMKNNYDAERKRMESSENTLNNSLRTFESERLNEMKFILKKYMQAEMMLAARKMEEMAKVYEEICRIDCESEAEGLIRALKETEFENAERVQ